jgi:hypothetical protein
MNHLVEPPTTRSNSRKPSAARRVLVAVSRLLGGAAGTLVIAAACMMLSVDTVRVAKAMLQPQPFTQTALLAVIGAIVAGICRADLRYYSGQ